MRTADWNVVFRELNDDFDRIADIVERPPIARAQAIRTMKKTLRDLAAEADSLPSPRGMTQQTAPDWTAAAVRSSCLMPSSYQLAADFVDKANVKHELISIAFALAAYVDEHGEYPEDLDALVPDYIMAIGLDPFSNRTYIYRRTEDGYLVYSVGTDQKDGNAEDEGRDIVVPRTPYEPWEDDFRMDEFFEEATSSGAGMSEAKTTFSEKHRRTSPGLIEGIEAGRLAVYSTSINKPRMATLSAALAWIWRRAMAAGTVTWSSISPLATTAIPTSANILSQENASLCTDKSCISIVSRT